MSDQQGFPNVQEPGEYGLSELTSNSLYNSRWASVRKVVDLVMAGHYHLLRPTFSEFIPTLSCPFHCPTCHYKRPKEQVGVWQDRPLPSCCYQMPLTQAKIYLEKLVQGGCKAVLLTGGGEPTYHPEFGQIVKHVRALGMTVSMSSNGTFAGGDFQPEQVIEYGFGNVRISLDTLRHHDTFHGYNKQTTDWLAVALENIGRICRVKKDAETRLTICVIFNEQNYEELIEIGVKVASFSGVNSLVIRPVIDYFGDNQVPQEIINQAQASVEQLRPILAQSKISVFFPRYRQVARQAQARNYTKCRACGLIGSVWPDGRMFICTETNGQEEFCIGDLTRQSLEEIYSSPRYKQVLDYVEQSHFSVCPVTCRPLNLNEVFDKIEQLRQAGEIEKISRWVEALGNQHIKECPWIQV